MTEPLPSPRGRRQGRASVWKIVLTTLAVLVGFVGAARPAPAAALADDDWLGIVNTYRAMSGLAPVGANDTWSAEATAHSCYMLLNGISHDETPGLPGYTPGGDAAGNSGNVAVSSSITAKARKHIDLWMTGPFHAIGILRHNLATSGFGLCTDDDTPTPWHSGGTLDVIRGLDGRPRPASPIVFPGNGSTVPLHSFVTEYPNPMEMCSWSGSAGLPLIAMMPARVGSASSSLTGPNGPIDTCTLHPGNTSDTAQAILSGDNAVVVMPREPLADGAYTARVDSSGGSIAWSFTVDRDAPLSATPQEDPPPATTKPTTSAAGFEPVDPFRKVDSRDGRGAVRLAAGKITRVPIAGDDVAAVSANFVAVTPDDYGYITAYNCTTRVPTVSTINYGPGQIVANQAIVPLQDGAMCLYSLVSTDVIVDINGYYRTSGGSGFVPVAPTRMLDGAAAGSLRAGVELPIRMTGVAGGAPTDATAVALNVTAVTPADYGYLQVYPCGATTASEISSINYVPLDYRPNSVVTPVDASGRICLRSLRDTGVIVDLTGYFADSGGYAFQALDPVRWFDSRSTNSSLNGQTGGDRVRGGTAIRLQIAGERGVAADAKAVAVNLTAIDAVGGTFLTAYPCGTRPPTSNLNLVPWQVVAANGAMVKLSSAGELCVYALADVHVIVDVNGVWR